MLWGARVGYSKPRMAGPVTPFPVQSKPSLHFQHGLRVDYLPVVFERLDRLARIRLAAGLTPGLAITVTGRQETLWSGCYGSMDLSARKPIRPATLFHLGPLAQPLLAVVLL